MKKAKLKLIKQVHLVLSVPVLIFFLFSQLFYRCVSLSKSGGINLYITGVTIRDSIVELMSPPIKTMANGAINGLGFNAIGSRPQIAVMDVNTTGRKRVSPAIVIASSMLWPSTRS